MVLHCHLALGTCQSAMMECTFITTIGHVMGAGEHWQWVPCIGIEDTAFKTCLVGLGRKRQTYHLFLYNRSLNSSLNSPF